MPDFGHHQMYSQQLCNPANLVQLHSSRYLDPYE